jgi:hypothetical protein
MLCMVLFVMKCFLFFPLCRPFKLSAAQPTINPFLFNIKVRKPGQEQFQYIRISSVDKFTQVILSGNLWRGKQFKTLTLEISIK